MAKDLEELKVQNGSGAGSVKEDLNGRLEKSEKRLGDAEESFTGLRTRLEQVGGTLFVSQNRAF
jgi:hypothetical protein